MMALGSTVMAPEKLTKQSWVKFTDPPPWLKRGVLKETEGWKLDGRTTLICVVPKWGVS